MQIPVDADLIFFLATLGNIGFAALPQLRKSVPPVPAKYQLEEVSPAALTPGQAAVFAPYDQKLAAMNYWPVCTYRVANYGHNLMRSYSNPSETSRCVVMLVEMKLTVGAAQPVSSTTLLSFHTMFADNTMLTTRNMPLKSVMDRPPYQTIQERPYIKEPAEMKREHDAQVAKMGCPVAAPSNREQIFKALNEEHDRFCAYQLEQGVLEPGPDGQTYVLTDKTHWRGVRNHLNPFVHRFYAWRFLPAALVTMFLPLVAVLKLAPDAARAAHNFGFPPSRASDAMMLACYTVAGAVLGLALENATFIWVLLLTYLPVRLIAPEALGPVPYSAFAGLVAWSISQARKRQRSVLLPQRAR